MTISELIAELQEIKNQHGDLSVFVYGAEWQFADIYEWEERVPVLEIYPSEAQLAADVPGPVRLLISQGEK